MPVLESQRWDCHGCTTCCRELVVHLTPRDVREIDRQDWSGKIAGPPYLRLGRETVLSHVPGDGCVFLGDDGKCRIHTAFGAEAKPLACQVYPFTLQRQGATLRAVLRFDCPSAAASRGSSLDAHSHQLARLAEAFDTHAPAALGAAARAPRLVADRRLRPVEAEHLASRLDAWLRDAGRPLTDRLAGVASFLDTLATARVDRLDEARLVELIDLLASEVPASAEAIVAADHPPPDDRMRKLLRMTVFSYCEHVSLEQLRAPLGRRMAYRWSQLRRARRVASGSGAIPSLATGLADTTFDRLRPVGVAADAADACEELATRYVRAKLLAGACYGAAYYEWPFVDGVRALLVSLAAARWIARYHAAADGRPSFTSDDFRRAIGLVDRAAGRARELGKASARLRITYLARDRGIIRLLRAGDGVT